MSDTTPEILSEPIRAYKLKQHANNNKEKVVIQTLYLYRKLAKQISNYHWRLFFEKKAVFGDYKKVSHIKNNLSERYKQTCQTQVVGTLNSYLSNVKLRFVHTVQQSTIEGEQKIQLFFINKHNLWFKKDVRMKNKNISEDTMLLARKIFKHLTKSKPRFKNYNMVLDEKIATLLKKGDEEKEASAFDYWVHISTKNKRKKIYIPLQINEYFESKGGVFKKSIQVNFKDGELSFSVIKQLKPEVLKHTSKRLGIDIGTVVFIATEHGELLGVELMKKVKKYDKIITRLFKNLRKQGIKPSANKRYVKLNKKVRELLKNEVGRIINRLIKRHLPKEIVVENLDFRKQNLGRTNNRVLNRFGKGILVKKLESVSEDKNIKLTKVNPAYTSQECPNCHYTHEKNRKERGLFVCGHCGLTCHADVVGARNSSSRSSAEFLGLNKREVFQVLGRKHEAWKELNKQNKRCHSSAKDLSRVGKESKTKKRNKL